jgi:hypothetical protein
MTDPRITKLLEAAEAIQRGRFKGESPWDREEETKNLGRLMTELGETFRQRCDEIKTLQRVAEKINAGFLLDEVLDYVYEAFRPIIPFDRIGCSFLEEEEGQEVVRAYWARSEASELKLTKGYTAPLEGSSLKRIIETGDPRILNDLEAYLREHPSSESTSLVVAEGMRSSFTCPLKALGKPIGFMFFSSTTPGTYRDAHVDIFCELATQLSLAVEKGRLYQRLLEHIDLKNKLLGMAAHDLRHPLNLFNMYLHILLDARSGEMSDEQLNYLKKMDKTCERMRSLIDALLDISAIEAGYLKLKAQSMDISKCLSEFCEAKEPFVIRRFIRLELDLEPGLPDIILDKERIEQVLDNLLSNALKFSHPDSTITFRAQLAEGEVRISCCDQGIGIPERDLPKMFTEFGRAGLRPPSGEKGSGLGLAICKRIVEAHGGRIWIESMLGKGTTVTFALPTESKLKIQE